jgi:two-component system, LuxR family, response regulator FixJ
MPASVAKPAAVGATAPGPVPDQAGLRAGTARSVISLVLRWINVLDLATCSIARMITLESRSGHEAMTADDHREPGLPVPVLLVVDDDAAVLNSLKFHLEIEGFEVRPYASAEALLNEPDLPSSGCLLIDYRMPEMTGLELLAKLRSNGVALPAILITGHPGLAVRQNAAQAGVAIIEKPLLGNGLTETIRSAVASATASTKAGS